MTGRRVTRTGVSPSLSPEQYRAALAATMTEASLLERIRAACRTTGVLIYHTHNSRRSERGFPDLVIVLGDRVLYRELKAARGRLTPQQRTWLDRLTAAGADAGVWRPMDWLDGTIPEALTGVRVLRQS